MFVLSKSRQLMLERMKKRMAGAKASPHQRKSLHDAGNMRNTGDEYKKVKEVTRAKNGQNREVAVKSKGGSLCGIEGKGTLGGSNLSVKKHGELRNTGDTRASVDIMVVAVEAKEGAVSGIEGKVAGNHHAEKKKESSLASGGKEAGLRYSHMSKGQQEKWNQMNKSPASRIKDNRYRPRGKTYRKAHYDPKEVPDDEAKQILERRQRNDSKAGGQSGSRMWGRKHPVLGGNRGHRRPYRERPDRPFNFDEDEFSEEGYPV